MGTTVVTLTVQMIFAARNESIISNYNRLPDNVMVHSVHKDDFLKRVIMASPRQSFITNKTKIFGMRLIWTDAIAENEIICTFDSFK